MKSQPNKSVTIALPNTDEDEDDPDNYFRESTYYQRYSVNSDEENNAIEEDKFDEYLENYELQSRLDWNSFSLTFKMIVYSIVMVVVTWFLIVFTKPMTS